MKDTAYTTELLGKKGSLELHLTANFYPPLPEFVKKSAVDAFEEHWNGELDDLDELARLCYLRNTDALYRYFSDFLNDNGEDY